MAAPTKRPADMTGRQAEILAEKAIQDGLNRDKELSLLTLKAEAEKSEVHDLTEKPTVEIAEPVAVVVDEKPVTIRLNSTLEKVTVGYGTSYDFNEGESYRVPKHVADHLESKGYVWH